MTSATDHNSTASNGHTFTSMLPPDPALPHPQLSLGELREEAERLIAGMGRPVRRVSLRAGANVVEVDWSSPEEAPAVPAPTVGTVAAAAPGAPAVPAVPAAPDGDTAGAAPAHTVRAPLVGTVYLAPEPGAAPFVAVGDRVSEGQQLAIVEAMKLMNPIVADRDGVVTRVVAEDAAMVEFDAVLFELGEE
ncbi:MULTISPECIES: acetyl-CoA carboxylase biotin carboxyl carrier protein subunit [unclassified Nocardiopsis]|uniref:acetyl-CoA carboxylase biotin carboxyl carrier protein n=1 Tax=unclassified Nocardiopsis TaxID=2649073 RepID=UPI001914DD6D|nr:MULTISPECIES: acetyl-CoA carboxylase biotin carboxyl carrier protein subunit [unclassified Nocardiopsis]